MHILVTNDDGVFAPGIFALQKALHANFPDAQITIMAPMVNQSAVGHRKTLRDPLRIDQVKMVDGTLAHACSGSPADAVSLALMGYIEDKVDIVVSGVNQGGNMGQDVTYSGTVTAAMESVIFGVPAIAISYDSYTDQEFEAGADFAARLVPVVLDHGLPEYTLLNVNIPCRDEFKGVQVTRQGKRLYHDRLIVREDPQGTPYYWIGGDRPTGEVEEEGTDVWAVDKGYISITPIHLDLTNASFSPEVAGWDIQP